MSQAPDGSSPAEGVSEADYEMVVAHDGTHTKVRFEAGERSRARSNGLIPTFGDARTAVVFDEEANVVWIEGTEAMSAAVVEAGQSGAIPADSAAALQTAFIEANQLTNARAAWGNSLTVWHGREFRCGESQSVRIRTTAYFAANVNLVEMDATLEYVEEVDCPSERESEARCVHLRMNLEADPASLRAAREIWARTTGDTASTPEANVRRRIDLVVEPDGLIPHEYTLEEMSQLVWVAQGQRAEREIYDMSSYRFFYGAPTTNIVLNTDGAGYQVVQDGRVLSAPDTPECRALAACCSAAASAPNPGTINLMCALSSAPTASEARPDDVPCEAELFTIHSMLENEGVPLPDGCHL